MKLFITIMLVLSGAAQANKIQEAPVYIEPGKHNYLRGDIIPTAELPGVPTHCGGTLHTGIDSNELGYYAIPDTPIQETQPKCNIDITGHLQVGTMLWYACSQDHAHPIDGIPASNCAQEALQFTVVQGTAPSTALQPPTNLKKAP